MKTKQRHILLMLSIVLFIALSFIILYSTSPLNRPIYRGGFTRTFVEAPVGVLKHLDLKVNSFYIAGTTSDRIYLGNKTAPLIVSETDSTLDSFKQYSVKLVGIDSVKEPRLFRTTIFGNKFILSHGNFPIILKGDIGHWRASPFMPGKRHYFTDIEPMSANTFALKSFNTSLEGFQLAKETALDSPQFVFNMSALTYQVDKIFSVTGEMHFAPKISRLVYLYTYRNEYVVFDTTLNNRYAANTIDTFAHAQIKVAAIEKGTQRMLASPPPVVNDISFVYENYLLIRSNLLSKGESEIMFKGNSVIDVYDVDQGIYRHSFYIPDIKGVRFSDFAVWNDRLIAIYGDILISYRLPRELFRNNDLKEEIENKSKKPLSMKSGMVPKT